MDISLTHGEISTVRLALLQSMTTYKRELKEIAEIYPDQDAEFAIERYEDAFSLYRKLLAACGVDPDNIHAIRSDLIA